MRVHLRVDLRIRHATRSQEVPAYRQYGLPFLSLTPPPLRVTGVRDRNGRQKGLFDEVGGVGDVGWIKERELKKTE